MQMMQPELHFHFLCSNSLNISEAEGGNDEMKLFSLLYFFLHLSNWKAIEQDKWMSVWCLTIVGVLLFVLWKKICGVEDNRILLDNVSTWNPHIYKENSSLPLMLFPLKKRFTEEEENIKIGLKICFHLPY